MINYIYDGTFEGLLCVIFEIYNNKQIPNAIYTKGKVQSSLLYDSMDIITDLKKSDRVYKGIKNKISNHALKHSYYVHLSEYEKKEILIYQYFKMGFDIGKDVDRLKFDNIVLKVHEISRKVTCEAHRMLGLLRFSNLYQDIYYAVFEPDNNILNLISDHFAKRMSDQRWIIHDKARNIASIYNKESWIITDFNLDEKIIYSNKEKDLQAMWKKYYDTIGIKERKNSKVRNQYMPKRYWRNLTEMKL
jgi:probable DNA metabolism protein